jgi:hypothetical protein
LVLIEWPLENMLERGKLCDWEKQVGKNCVIW